MAVMNWPNRLTVARLLATALFVLLMSLPFNGHYLAAFIVFLVAAFTDFLDGYLARKYNLITDFGKLMDPLADKVLMTAGFIMLVPIIPAWVVVFILAREFLVTGLRTLAASKGIVLAAENLGKWKTVLQVATIAVLLGILAFPALLKNSSILELIATILIYVTLLITVLSGLNYALRNRSLYLHH